MTTGSGMRETIVIVRLGALGDIVHSLPVATSLKLSFPSARIVWVTRPVWMPLFAGNPYLDEVVALDTKNPWRDFGSFWRALRALKPARAIDVQGLIQSAVVARITAPRRLWGFDRHDAREPLACMFYSDRVRVTGPHRVERNLQLAAAAGAVRTSDEAWIPQGSTEGDLPDGPFVLASPLAGWKGKQWPLEFYGELAVRLAAEGLPLVLNVPAARVDAVAGFGHVRMHVSSIAGLIDATRRAVAVVGVDRGPLHLAAALRKPGVAIYGPTDPAITGPYGGTMTVLRTASVQTTYARDETIHPSMRAIAPDQVANTLRRCLASETVLP